MTITQEQLLAAYHKVATLSAEEVRQVLLTDYARKTAFSVPKNLKRALLLTLLTGTVKGADVLGRKVLYQDIRNIFKDSDMDEVPPEKPIQKITLDPIYITGSAQ